MMNWEAIVRRHSRSVWHAAYRLLGNDADAADCVQETFVSALAVSRREPVRDWPALLGRLATARALDRLRQRIRETGRIGATPQWSDLPSPEVGPAAHAEAAELAERLREALALLPHQQAEVFCLRHFDALSDRQIARQLALKNGTVRVLLHRARTRLRELLASVAAPEP